MHLVSTACEVVLEPGRRRSSRKSDDESGAGSLVLRKRISKVCDEDQREDDGFSAEEFVHKLLNEGCGITCDESNKSFNENTTIPPFYDEDLYKTGQQFFYKHLFGLLFSNFLGLIMLLALPTVRVLMMTNRSSTPMTAYRRYMATILHMCIWYDSDFREGSKLWSSIGRIKDMHNLASRQSSNQLDYRINQKDMALTQFGFMGFGLVRSKMVGVHDSTEEELRGFIHVWRVVGYVLGLEDRFNLCRESVTETKEICKVLIDRVFRPYMSQPTEDFDKMSKALIEGMWVMNPFLQHDVFLCYLHMTLEDSNYRSLSREDVKTLSSRSKIKLYTVVVVMWALQFPAVRTFYKYLQLTTLWIMRVFPFLAYKKFGRQNAQVTV